MIKLEGEQIMTKKEFCKIMNALEDELERQRKISKGLTHLCPNSFIMIENPLFGIITDFLEDRVGDIDNWIDRFIWIWEFGKKDEPFYFEDDEECYIRDSGELYDFIVEMYNSKVKTNA